MLPACSGFLASYDKSLIVSLEILATVICGKFPSSAVPILLQGLSSYGAKTVTWALTVFFLLPPPMDNPPHRTAEFTSNSTTYYTKSAS
jgi:hypothetical protein